MEPHDTIQSGKRQRTARRSPSTTAPCQKQPRSPPEVGLHQGQQQALRKMVGASGGRQSHEQGHLLQKVGVARKSRERLSRSLGKADVAQFGLPVACVADFIVGQRGTGDGGRRTGGSGRVMVHAPCPLVGSPFSRPKRTLLPRIAKNIRLTPILSDLSPERECCFKGNYSSTNDTDVAFSDYTPG